MVSGKMEVLHHPRKNPLSSCRQEWRQLFHVFRDRITGRVDEMIYPEYFNPGNGRDQGAQACLVLSIKELFFEFER